MPAVKLKKTHKAVEQMIVDTIIQHIKPKQIILFGSRARDDAQSRSDYDIAIDDNELTPAKLAQIRADLETLPTLLSIDLVWMSRAAETLRQRILNEGKTLYEHNPTS